MECVFDLWVNWSEGSVKSYGIPHFYEWQQGEETELMERIPVLLVTEEFLRYVEDGYGYIPDELLELVYNKARKVVKQRNVIVDYAFVLADGNRTLAVFTDGTNRPEYKSRLLPKQEAHVLRHVEGAKRKDFECFTFPDSRVATTVCEKIMDIKTEYMVGLTRVEREMKEIVLDCLLSLATSDDIEETIYWYTGLFPDVDFTARSLRKVGRDPMVEAMFDFLKIGWSPRHEEFAQDLVVYGGLYKDTWQNLVKEKQELITN